jgi:RNA polymerase sigma factor (TIGR02999 family)
VAQRPGHGLADPAENSGRKKPHRRRVDVESAQAFTGENRVTTLADVTGLLRAWRGGSESALERLMPLVYAQLRQIARRHLRGERPDHSLQATALVNEAYLRLVDVNRVDYRDRAHFFAMAARVMRRVLVDRARARRYQKRGGSAIRVTLDDGLVAVGDRGRDLVARDDALEALSRVAERKCRVVELRFFAGLTVEESAAVLSVSPDTITRDWHFARTWLKRELTRGATAS